MDNYEFLKTLSDTESHFNDIQRILTDTKDTGQTPAENLKDIPSNPTCPARLAPFSFCVCCTSNKKIGKRGLQVNDISIEYI